MLAFIIVVHSRSWIQLFATPWTIACQASLSFTSSWNLLRFLSIESVMPSNHLILCRPLLFLPLIFPNIRVFSNELALHIRWPKYYSFSNEYSNEYWNIPMNIQDLFPLGLTLPIMYLRRKCQPTPVFLLGESHGWRSLVGYSPRDSQRVGHDWVT